MYVYKGVHKKEPTKNTYALTEICMRLFSLQKLVVPIWLILSHTLVCPCSLHEKCDYDFGDDITHLK